MTGKPSILHVISNLNAGGAEKMLVTAANLFVKKGHKVGVVLLVEEGPLSKNLDSRVNLHGLNRKGRFDFHALHALSKLANSYEVIHVHLKHNLKFVFVANLIWRIKSSVILHDHSAEVLTTGVKKTHLNYFVQRWLRKQAYIGVSENLTTWAIGNFKLCPENCFTLSNAIECKEGDIPRRQAPIGKVNIIMVSNFRRIKNIEFGIILVNRLIRAGISVRFDIFGHISDTQYFMEIKKLIVELNVMDSISINTEVSDVTPYLHKYNLAIHCSKAETGPLVLMEYLCAGLPFLSIKQGEVALAVEKSFPELVIEHFLDKEWCERIKQIIRKDYFDALKQFFKNEYSLDLYYQRLNSIYENVTYDRKSH